MIAVIFEVEPKSRHATTYFDIAAELRAVVEQVDGFISIERFESVSQPGKYLSLSFWRDEAAISAWRSNPAHQNAQETGRNELFKQYRIRVAPVVRDYGR
jgi:heme-degrading monooxygenase HmoA